MDSKSTRDEFISRLTAKSVSDRLGAVHDAAILLLHTIRAIHGAAVRWDTGNEARATLHEQLPHVQPDIARLDALLSDELSLSASRLHAVQPSVCGLEVRSYLEGVLMLGWGLQQTMRSHHCFALHEDDRRAKRKPRQHAIQLTGDADTALVLKYDDEFLKTIAKSAAIYWPTQFLNIETRLQSEVDKLSALNQPVDEPPSEIVTELSPKHQTMIEVLWKKRSMRMAEFTTAVWRGKTPKPESVLREIGRANNDLVELNAPFAMRTKGQRITLDRPDKL